MKKMHKGILIMSSAVILAIFMELGQNVMQQLLVPAGIVKTFTWACLVHIFVLMIYGAFLIRCQHCDFLVAGQWSKKCRRCKKNLWG